MKSKKREMVLLFYFLSVFFFSSCKPSADTSQRSNVRAIISSTGKDAKALLFIPTINIFSFSENELKYLNDDVKNFLQTPFFALIECEKNAIESANKIESLIKEYNQKIKETITQGRSLIDEKYIPFGLDEQRQVYILNRKNNTIYPERLSCKTVGERLMSYAVYQYIIDHIMDKNNNIVGNFYNIAQAIFLALRGAYDERQPKKHQFYSLAYMTAYQNKKVSLKNIDNNMMKLDSLFNPCIKTSENPKILEKKMAAFTCQKAGSLSHYMPGGKSKNYDEVKSMITNSIASIHNEIHSIDSSSNAIPKDHIWDSLTSTKSISPLSGEQIVNLAQSLKESKEEILKSEKTTTLSLFGLESISSVFSSVLSTVVSAATTSIGNVFSNSSWTDWIPWDELWNKETPKKKPTQTPEQHCAGKTDQQQAYDAICRNLNGCRGGITEAYKAKCRRTTSNPSPQNTTQQNPSQQNTAETQTQQNPTQNSSQQNPTQTDEQYCAGKTDQQQAYDTICRKLNGCRGGITDAYKAKCQRATSNFGE